MCGQRRSAAAQPQHEGQVAAALPASSGRVLFPGAAHCHLFSDRVVH